MADNRNYFCFCEDNCKFPTMTKEQILTAIKQAVETGKIKNVDAGFITRIVEQNKGVPLAFWVGTQAEYNAIENKANNCFYIVTDDTMKEDIEAAIANFSTALEAETKARSEEDAKLAKSIENNVTRLNADVKDLKNKCNGVTLFKNTSGIGENATFTCADFDKYILYAITIKYANFQTVVIGGNKTSVYNSVTGRQEFLLSAHNLLVNTAGETKNNYAIISLETAADTHTVVKAKYMDNDGVITKIVGYM